MFIDHVDLDLVAGKGGNGAIAWRREKYLAKGGPYGGDGGDGGSIILEADHQISSLEAYRNCRIVKAENGGQGGANNRKGKNGCDLVMKLPLGTLIKDRITGNILYDFTKDKESWVICQGGRGGKGNTYFKSSTNRTPNYATSGKLGESLKVECELKLIADVGLVGFPNAGKSTFVSQITSIPVKVASYPFTTLHPNLRYLICEDKRILIADIPGIIKQAHMNKGLGFKFLRHIERTRLLLFILDGSGYEERDPLEDFETLCHEIREYNPQLINKPFIIILNKIDKGFVGDSLLKKYPHVPIFKISALTGEGVKKILGFLKNYSDF
ncbi:MAG: GTPase ObgE [Chlamydiales bacterium]